MPNFDLKKTYDKKRLKNDHKQPKNDHKQPKNNPYAISSSKCVSSFS